MNKASATSPHLVDPPSPCIGVCALDGPEGLCVGCLRTGDEIAEWPTATAQRRRAILDDVERRNPRAASPDPDRTANG
ncbi:DUF1289 domain-containing protein [Algiphilus sp.]|nr:DUF1289 domain-containing protein [Pseudomonadota bacterium]